MRTFDRLAAGRQMPNHYAAAGVCPGSAKKIARFDSMRRAVFAVESVAMALPLTEINRLKRERDEADKRAAQYYHDWDRSGGKDQNALAGYREAEKRVEELDRYLRSHGVEMSAVTMAYTGDPDALAHINEGDRVRAVQGGRELWSGTVVRCVRGTDNSGLRPRTVTDSIVVRTADGGTEAVDTYSMYIYKTKVEKV